MDPKAGRLKSGNASIEETVCDKAVSSGRQAASTSGLRRGGRETTLSRVNRYERADNASRDARKVRVKRLSRPIKSKQK